MRCLSIGYPVTHKLFGKWHKRDEQKKMKQQPTPNQCRLKMYFVLIYEYLKCLNNVTIGLYLKFYI